jgi:methanol--5-hydroxybenzimidazolylcobamide Co-methyltransferase
VQYVRLLSAYAPTVSLEQLAYDCRLLNVTSARSAQDARTMRDWLVESDAGLDPQAWVLRPDVVLPIARKIAAEPTPYLQTRAAAHAAAEEIATAAGGGKLRLSGREMRWLDKLRKEIDDLPDDETVLIQEMLASPVAEKFLPEEYGL